MLVLCTEAVIERCSGNKGVFGNLDINKKLVKIEAKSLEMSVKEFIFSLVVGSGLA